MNLALPLTFCFYEFPQIRPVLAQCHANIGAVKVSSPDISVSGHKSFEIFSL